MGNLPDNLGAGLVADKTIAAIYKAYEDRNAAEGRAHSRRLGASAIGNACDRAVWYGFRHVTRPQFPGRVLRLFDTGHREEPRIVDDLRAIGCTVHDVDDRTGEQFTFTELAGHFVVKLDGAVIGLPEAPATWHACEFKTSNAKGFAKLKKDGLRKAKPEHHKQLVAGMALGKLDRGLYLSKNKDTDELYAERVRWEDVREDAAALFARAERIIRASSPPAKIQDDPDKFPCGWCDHRELCQGDRGPIALPILVTCRSCVHATPEMDTEVGRWSCEKYTKTISASEQAAACPSHLAIPGLISFAEPVDTCDDDFGGWIEYRNADGTVWRQGHNGEAGHYTTGELTRLPGPLVGGGIIDDVKGDADGWTVTGVQTLEQRARAARVVWTMDDAPSEGTERIGAAWVRMFGERIPNDDRRVAHVATDSAYISEYRHPEAGTAFVCTYPDAPEEIRMADPPHCATCGEPQGLIYSGLVCINGHGGAASTFPTRITNPTTPGQEAPQCSTPLADFSTPSPAPSQRPEGTPLFPPANTTT